MVSKNGRNVEEEILEEQDVDERDVDEPDPHANNPHRKRFTKSRPLVLPHIIAKGFSWELFTPTEQRILVLLSDGRDHLRNELLECLLDDKFANYRMVTHHLNNLRCKLRMLKHDIVCVNKFRQYHYRWVRNLLVKK